MLLAGLANSPCAPESSVVLRAWTTGDVQVLALIYVPPDTDPTQALSLLPLSRLLTATACPIFGDQAIRLGKRVQVLGMILNRSRTTSSGSRTFHSIRLEDECQRNENILRNFESRCSRWREHGTICHPVQQLVAVQRNEATRSPALKRENIRRLETNTNVAKTNNTNLMTEQHELAKCGHSMGPVHSSHQPAPLRLLLPTPAGPFLHSHGSDVLQATLLGAAFQQHQW